MTSVGGVKVACAALLTLLVETLVLGAACGFAIEDQQCVQQSGGAIGADI